MSENVLHMAPLLYKYFQFLHGFTLLLIVLSCKYFMNSSL